MERIEHCFTFISFKTEKYNYSLSNEYVDSGQSASLCFDERTKVYAVTCPCDDVYPL